MFIIVTIRLKQESYKKNKTGEDFLLLKAVIFDMDGVIIDSEPMHARAAILTLKEFNVDISMDYLQNFIGSTTYYMCQKMISDFNLNTTLEDFYQVNIRMKEYLLQKEGHTVVPYIIDLIKDLSQNGIKLTIASSSPAEAIEEVMNSLNIRQYFNSYVSGMHVKNSKPAPDIFLEAARRLDVTPEECIVIEDSFHGVTAAQAAGMTCIGFVNPNSGNQDLRKASILVEGFDEVDYAFLNQIYQSNHFPAVILTSENFIIRELTVSDIPKLYELYQNISVREFLDDMKESLEIEQEKHKAYIQNIYRYYGFGLWGVILKENATLVGRCGIEYKVFKGEAVYEIAYLLDPAHQSHGYAKEFVTAVIQHCFKELDIHRIIAVIDKRNVRSLHLAEQIGMKRFGECSRDERDCYCYEITYHC
jgi:haloacid dehalogenase superfamily, subfamily IA, variant 3 with third motif having DD or ED/haloacid dehalogenase superfamily, subfamily IA, variant 1 with third motif having Dx(3-4)D or Dx(3-4)E/beta-phosphoglucomutase family hydrolase